MVNWDSIIGALIIIALILAAWSKISNQTIAETIRDIKDIITDSKDEIEENAREGLTFYE